MRRLPAAAALALLTTSCFETAPVTPGTSPPKPFNASVKGLPMARPTRILEAGNGDTVTLTVNWVAKWVSGRKVRMLAYDSSIPGPTLKVPQGAEITLLLKNETGLPTSLHSHGVRLDYRQDGMPGISQSPIDSGKTHAYAIRFPDPGVYWYHPHVREDYGIELGLYGNYLVVPSDSTYWPPVHREAMLMLDDILLEGDSLRPFYSNQVDYTLMGRFGNHFLVNGDTDFTMRVKQGEVIRFYATNAAGARVFNLKFEPAMDFHIIGADNGRFEYPSIRFSDIIAPSERLIFQVLFKRVFDRDDTLRLFHSYSKRGGEMKNLLATFIYDGDTAATNLDGSIDLARNPQAAASIEPFRASFGKRPDRYLQLTGTMDMTGLMKTAVPAHDPDLTDGLGVEWFDEMGMMSTGSNDRNTRWIMRDDETGAENHAIDWVFKKGDKVLIRVYNDPKAMHSMPHPIHFHGQRFLVLREQGRWQKENLVWRDSYLIGRGFSVDLLLDASNPGEWMMHCHIPEHLEAEMMGHFKVLDAVPPAKTPYPWTLSLKADAGLATFNDDTTLNASVEEEISGQVNGFNPSIIAPQLTFANIDLPGRNITASLDAQGRFRFPAKDLLGDALGLMNLHISPKVSKPGYRAVPYKIRLKLNRSAPQPWSLDLDLAGDASFKALVSEAAAQGAFMGEFSGKVNGFDRSILQDTIFFVNAQYPAESTVRAPLRPDGSFRFDADGVLGSSDGTIFVDISLKADKPGYYPAPGEIRLTLDRVINAGAEPAGGRLPAP